jgi:CrcB protein
VNPWSVALLALAGGIGAVARYLLDDAVTRARTRRSATGAPGPFPAATVLINVTGSLALGALTGALQGGHLTATTAAVLGTGFCGGYTTFSTAMVETARLGDRREVAIAATNLLGTLVLAVGAAALGWWLTA